MERVGVRALRQHLSVYLRRIRTSGEALEVTEHGRPVALLAPLPEPDDPVERLVRLGRVRPPAAPWSDLAPPAGRPGTAGTDALRADREGKA